MLAISNINSLFQDLWALNRKRLIRKTNLNTITFFFNFIAIKFYFLIWKNSFSSFISFWTFSNVDKALKYFLALPFIWVKAFNLLMKKESSRFKFCLWGFSKSYYIFKACLPKVLFSLLPWMFWLFPSLWSFELLRDHSHLFIISKASLSIGLKYICNISVPIAVIN